MDGHPRQRHPHWKLRGPFLLHQAYPEGSRAAPSGRRKNKTKAWTPPRIFVLGVVRILKPRLGSPKLRSSCPTQRFPRLPSQAGACLVLTSVQDETQQHGSLRRYVMRYDMHCVHPRCCGLHRESSRVRVAWRSISPKRIQTCFQHCWMPLKT